MYCSMEKNLHNVKFAPGSISYDLSQTETELEKKKKVYNSVNLMKLPDKGARLKKQIDELENSLKALNLEAGVTGGEEDKIKRSCNPLSENGESVIKVVKDSNNKHEHSDEHKNEIIKQVSFKKDEVKSVSENFNTKEMLSFSDLTPKQTTRKNVSEVMNSPSFKNWRDSGKAHKTLLTEAKPLVESSVSKSSPYYFSSNNLFHTSEECVKKMHNSLVMYPDDTNEETEPENLKSSLMTHQKRALAWLIWREQQEPCGGILADDMGLGKTLTMISLILKQKEKCDDFSQNEKKSECKGTLIVCVASIIHQWRDEVTKHCEQDALKVLVYHGSQRVKDVKVMRNYDVVLTTYNIVMSEKKAAEKNKVESPLFKLKWERIILDEAHTIKNHVSQTANAVFSLKGFKKWAVTGTPIHNVFKDIYSLVKFLEFSPFDDYKKFKALTDECSESGEARRNLLIKTIVLRRTKDQVDEWGKPLIAMRDKSTCLSYIELSTKERKIYDKLNEKITKKFHQYLKKPSKLNSSSSLLVMLLRLQQCCNHLSLLEKETEEDDIAIEITNRLSSLYVDDTPTNSNSSDSNLSIDFNELDTDELWDISVKSSKIRELLNELNKISEVSKNKDKSVIVSQWVSMLNVIEYHLKEEKVDYYLIEGSTKVEDRQKFANDFNYNKKSPRIILLSLKAGGVGLNLVGANHLFLMDLHWNPALEMQACDRIHRVGQEKDVTIHKFICKNTIEEKIKSLQDEKRRIASSALHGTKQNVKGLSLDDFKVLFNSRR